MLLLIMEQIEILQNCKTWLVVNKPAGLSVHNNEDDTNLIKLLDRQGHKGLSPINRLDKETSGIMILSFDSDVSRNLQASLSEQSTLKSYLAIVKGTFSQENQKGSWNQDLTNKAEGRKNPLGMKKDRVKSLTNFKVIKANKYLTLLELTIETGRQHQIRKHCLSQKHQVIGDQRYGDQKFNTLIKKKYLFNNMALHSHRLSFKFENKNYSFSTPPPNSWMALEVYNTSSLNS
ncbi:MAG: RNA pseudouridine synthase [Halobacteriovoraceae bacterium]|nr:RNA pseudouridine synthase [Halobacteriovoraceae bacterium]